MNDYQTPEAQVLLHLDRKDYKLTKKLQETDGASLVCIFKIIYHVKTKSMASRVYHHSLTVFASRFRSRSKQKVTTCKIKQQRSLH